MADSLQETNVEEIANELKMRRNQGQRTTLFLGSRTGGLFDNEYFYETLKQFSLLNFDTLSNIDKFRECYYVLLKHFKEIERHNILVGTLATLRYREEDELLAALIRANFFETIITTNIDSLLEEACSLSDTYFQTFIPGMSDAAAIDKTNYRRNTIIKLFGDIESRHYLTPGETFDLHRNGLYAFLQSNLGSDVLMVGYDPVWDHEIEQIFPLTGKTIRYINETEMPPHSHLASLLKQRNVRFLPKSRGIYSSFVRDLYSNLAEEVHFNVITAPLPAQPQDSIKDEKRVFISYSHKDGKYFDRLITHLKGYFYLLKGTSQLKDAIDIWDDTKIRVGANWQAEIEKALAQAGVAILLISANYLSSRLVITKELPLLLEAARRGKVKLLPIILDQSPLLSKELEPLNQYQVVNSSSKPLRWMNPYEREVVWDKLAEQVCGILDS